MKKLIAFLLVAVMCFSLTACGGSQEAENSNTEVSKEETTDNTVETESEVVDVEGEPFGADVCLAAAR